MVDIIVVLETASASHYFARRFFRNESSQLYWTAAL